MCLCSVHECPPQKVNVPTPVQVLDEIALPALAPTKHGEPAHHPIVPSQPVLHKVAPDPFPGRGGGEGVARRGSTGSLDDGSYLGFDGGRVPSLRERQCQPIM